MVGPSVTPYLVPVAAMLPIAFWLAMVFWAICTVLLVAAFPYSLGYAEPAAPAYRRPQLGQPIQPMQPYQPPPVGRPVTGPIMPPSPRAPEPVVPRIVPPPAR